MKSLCAKHGIEYHCKPLLTAFADIVQYVSTQYIPEVKGCPILQTEQARHVGSGEAANLNHRNSGNSLAVDSMAGCERDWKSVQSWHWFQ